MSAWAGRRRMYLGPLLFALLSVNCGAIEIEPVGGDEELVAPAVISPGASFTASGTSFEEECRSIGCASCPAPASPMENIVITLRQGERSWVLATVDADKANRITARVTAPADLEAGEAVLSAERASTTVTVAPAGE